MSSMLRGRSDEYQTAYKTSVGFGNILILDSEGDSESRETSESCNWWNSKDLSAKLRELFHRYLDRKRDKVIVLRGIVSNKPVILPYTTRFDGNYRQRVVERLGKIVIKKGTHLTLTCDLKRFTNIIDATQAVKKGWDRIRGSLKKRFGGKLDYLLVLEFGPDSNMPHLHILLQDVEFQKNDIIWLRKLWEKHVATFLKVSRIVNANAARYVLKYLKKTFNKSGVVANDGNAWCYWLTNAKFYSTSADLIPESDEEIIESVIEELTMLERLLANFDAGYNPESYEYIGFCSAWHMKDPPDVMDDEWLLDHGWNREVDYDGNFVKWIPPSDVILNVFGEVSKAEYPDILAFGQDEEEAGRWMKRLANVK